MEPSARCPICGAKVAVSREEPGSCFPFCSVRCKQIDLGQWLGEGYRIPGKPVQDAPRLEETGDSES